MKLRSILNEMQNSAVNVEKLYIQQLHRFWEFLKTEYPEEHGINDSDYMEYECYRNLSFLERGTSNILSAMKNLPNKSTTVIKAPYSPKSKVRGACYFNSLDFIKKYYEKNQKLELAWGIVCFENDLNTELQTALKSSKASYSVSISQHCFLHAFCILDGKVIDPTMGQKWDGQSYFYEIVPKSKWESFVHVYTDDQPDARPFYNYIEGRNAKNKSVDYILKELKKK